MAYLTFCIAPQQQIILFFAAMPIENAWTAVSKVVPISNQANHDERNIKGVLFIILHRD